MSATTDALEHEVGCARAIRARYRAARDRRCKAQENRHFDRIMALLGPRIRHLTRAYGLNGWADDAEQACAIAVHRAIDEYDPSIARFTTFVTWPLRGELKALRNRVRPELRETKASMRYSVVPLDHGEGEFIELVDVSAMTRVEQGAARRLAHTALDRLLSEYERGIMDRLCKDLASADRPGGARPGPGRAAIDEMKGVLCKEREIVARYVFADGKDDKFAENDANFTAEQQRQISRRVLRHLSAKAPAI
ncbi:sigma factor [Croceicoccus hydrothermalis]|uniref:sigma factor n=1 Tax=Croceicoccus hydrothermalis TaxID=2867964 RepID=UPI001EFA4FFE|nr:sigma factor [Croceicoccus hydrothermalis]